MDETKSSHFKGKLDPVKSFLLRYPIIFCILSGIAGITVMVSGTSVISSISEGVLDTFVASWMLIVFIGSLLVIFSMAFSIWNIKKPGRKFLWFYISWGAIMALPTMTALYLIFCILMSIFMAINQYL